MILICRKISYNDFVVSCYHMMTFRKLIRGAPDLEFPNPAGTGFGQKFGPDLPDLR